MRRVAQRFDLGVQRAMVDHERWAARCDSEILLVSDNVHIPRSDEAEAAFQRNTETVMKVARAVHMPVSSRKRIERALDAKWKASTPPASTAEHRAYAAKVTPPDGPTACTLDRSCRGMAVLEERAYHAAMEDLFLGTSSSTRFL